MKILEDIKVAEFAQNVAIPHCGRLLAAMGADVVKIEPPQGDAMRHLGRLLDDEGRTYAVTNPGKRSMTLDLQSDGAKPVIEALFRWADVVLVAFKGSDLDRYGLSWEHAKSIDPSLIHLTHTPFGPEGPDALVGGYDVLAQATSGIGFFMNRTENGVPTSTRPAINDMGTGVYSALGVVAALRHRDKTGEGQRVDTSLLGTAVSFGMPVLGFFPDLRGDQDDALEAELRSLQAEGASFEDIRNHYENSGAGGQVLFKIYFRHYQTSDGMIAVAALSGALRQRFHDATGIDEPSEALRPGTPELSRLVAESETVLASASSEHWLTHLRSFGVPCARYNLPYDVPRDPQVRANGYMVELDHPTIGRYVTTGMPVQFETTPAPIDKPSPQLAAHTEEILSELGFDQTARDRLAAENVVTRRDDTQRHDDLTGGRIGYE